MRPLPRSQVRSDLQQRLLRAGRHLRQHRLSRISVVDSCRDRGFRTAPGESAAEETAARRFCPGLSRTVDGGAVAKDLQLHAGRLEGENRRPGGAGGCRREAGSCHSEALDRLSERSKTARAYLSRRVAAPCKTRSRRSRNAARGGSVSSSHSADCRGKEKDRSVQQGYPAGGEKT